MQILKISLTLGLFASGAFAAIGDACSSSLGSGSCQKTTDCGGFTVTGACPHDPANVKCCIKKTCSTPSGTGTCKNTSSACAGSYIAGFCPGDSTIKCCVPTPNQGGGVAARVIAAAKTQAGVPYSWGGGGCNGRSKGIDTGKNTNGFDCSGLTQYAICQATSKATVIPRTTYYQYSAGKRIPVANAQPGDLVFYGHGGNCSCDSHGYCKEVYHVAIYLGNNRVWQAQKTGTLVGEFPFSHGGDLCQYAVRYW